MYTAFNPFFPYHLSGGGQQVKGTSQAVGALSRLACTAPAHLPHNVHRCFVPLLHTQVVVVVNKIDRPAARAEWVVDSTFELFMDLGATDEQCDFPVVYASGVNGIAGLSPTDLASDLQPLFETIVREVRGTGRLGDGWV
jgi:hypothetical protein